MCNTKSDVCRRVAQRSRCVAVPAPFRNSNGHCNEVAANSPIAPVLLNNWRIRFRMKGGVYACDVIPADCLFDRPLGIERRDFRVASASGRKQGAVRNDKDVYFWDVAAVFGM